MPQRKNIILVILLCVMTLTNVYSAVGGGVPMYCEAKGQKLVLNGSGVREKCFIDLFSQSLYLKQKSKDANYVVNANEPMAIKIVVTSNVITGKRLESNMRSEFDRVTNGNIQPYKDRIEALANTFKENVKKGDVYDLVYDPKDGMSIYKNNQIKITIPGLDFKRTLFTMWLGDDPADVNVKKAMLNG